MSKVGAWEIVNIIVTILLLLAVSYAGYQRFFDNKKCEEFCSAHLKSVQVERMGEVTL